MQILESYYLERKTSRQSTARVPNASLLRREFGSQYRRWVDSHL